MPKPRKALVSLDTTPYYHCVSRCVRRAFLCGTDTLTNTCYEHRRQFIEDKLLSLADIFAIVLCAYAVMSNHYHAVVHVDHAAAKGWHIEEVIERWHRLFKGTPLTQRLVAGDALSSAEYEAATTLAETWRLRLMDISWFFRIVNESIARQANQEDGCTGRFWEGRFRSDALLDEQALAACMAYVDLNPIRAKMAKTPEQSTHTSIKQRCKSAKAAFNPNHPNQQTKTLMPFAGNPRQAMPKGLPFRLTDYLALVDWTGRIIRENKRGAINQSLPSILERLNIDPGHWLYLSKHFESRCRGLVGTAYRVKAAVQQLGYQRTPGAQRVIETLPT